MRGVARRRAGGASATGHDHKDPNVMTTKSAYPRMLAWTAIMLQLSACDGQPGHQGAIASTDSTVQHLDTPKVDVRVNKQYDEHGNLISFDSTYSSVYTSRAGDAAFVDSVFKDFMPGFGMTYPFLNDPGFNSLFFPDTSFHRDFFHHDFFRKRMEMNQRYIQRMMEQMDSLKNQYFQRGMRTRPPATQGGLPGNAPQGSGLQRAPAPAQRSSDDAHGKRRETVQL